MAKGQYQIPFTASGDLSASGYASSGGIIWKDNFRFTDELEFTGFRHSRSSVQIHLKSVTDGRRYNMSLNDFSQCILENLFVSKRINTEFTFAKKGTKYMLTPTTLKKI